MMFQTYGNRNHPAVLFFYAMGVTGESSEPVANYLQDRYFCILPTSTVYQRAEICQQGGRGSSGGRIPEIAGGGTP